MMIEITRRRAVVILSGCWGMAWLAGLPTVDSSASFQSLTRQSLKQWLRALPGASQVGLAYLQTHPGDADHDRLLASVAGESPATLVKRQRDDFNLGRTVTIRGWVLSQTEARLCALAALA